MSIIKKLAYVIFLLQVLEAHSIGTTREYQYFPVSKTWAEAQRYCRENFVDLATIETEEEWSKVQKIVQNVTLTPWIGLYDDYTGWRWSLNGTYLYQESSTPFGNWLTFEPDNFLSNEHCVSLVKGYLNDDKCDALQYSVCYDEPTNSYINISEFMTWLEAQSYCRLHYTDLASIKGPEAKDAISAITNFTIAYWVGLSRESWKWSDQSNFSLKKWALGEGQNSEKEDFCACANVTGFMDVNCSLQKPFICTVHVVMKTFKVKIQTESPNPNDQVVWDSLLQKLGRLFKEQNIQKKFTLRWRKQENGKPFTIE